MPIYAPVEPTTPCVPAVWHFADIEPHLMEGCRVISAKDADRRALPGRHKLNTILRQLGGLQTAPEAFSDSARGTEAFRTATQNGCITRHQAVHTGIRCYIGPRFIDDGNQPNRHSNNNNF